MNKEKIKEKLFVILYPISIIFAFLFTFDSITELLKQSFPHFNPVTINYVCFISEIALVMFFIKYNDDETHKKQQKHKEELYYIDLMHRLNYKNLSTISDFTLNIWSSKTCINIILNNDIEVSLDIEEVQYLNNQQKLEELDYLIESNSAKIIQQLKENYNISSDSTYYKFYLTDKYKDLINSYIRTLKDKNK